jgi:recombination protein RecA
MDGINQEAGKKLKGDDRKIVFGDEVEEIVKVPTGFALYDALVGGEPRGRITVDYGPESSGKSSWNYAKIASFQSKGLVCCVVDEEHGFDRAWAVTQGINMDDLAMVPGKDTLEATLDTVRPVIGSGLVDFVLVDSIHGAPPSQELHKKGKAGKPGKDRSLSDDTVALMARKIGQFIRGITPVLGKAKAMLTIIGQARDSVNQFNPGIVLTGGHQLKHQASCIRQWVRAAKSEWPSRTVDKIVQYLGFTARVKIEKTKLNGNENKVFKIPFLYYVGPSLVRANVDVALSLGLVNETSKARFSWGTEDGGTQELHGRDAVYGFFEQHRSEYERLSVQMYAAMARREQEEIEAD